MERATQVASPFALSVAPMSASDANAIRLPRIYETVNAALSLRETLWLTGFFSVWLPVWVRSDRFHADVKQVVCKRAHDQSFELAD